MTVWTPAHAANGYHEWWDAPDLTGSDGSTVTTWTGKRGRVLEGTGAARPTLQHDERNGLAVVRFDGTNDYLHLDELGLTGQPFSVLAVVKVAASPPTQVIFWSTGTTGVDSGAGLVAITNTIWIHSQSSSLASGTGYSGWCVVAGVYNADNSVAVTNGSAGSGAIGGLGPDDLYVGAKNATTEPLNGDLGELLFAPWAWSTGERRRYEGYAAWRWGLQTALVAGHPYEHTRPEA